MYGLKYVWMIVQVIPDYPRVHVTFADGVTHTFDLAYLFASGPAFEPLSDPDYFSKVGIVNGALTWPNESDIAPDMLYSQATGRSGWR